jgi:hypothetical protein
MPYLATLGNKVVIGVDHEKGSDLLMIWMSSHGNLYFGLFVICAQKTSAGGLRSICAAV